MNTKLFAIIVAVTAVSAANAITFTPGSSAPTVIRNGSSSTYGTSATSSSYSVTGLPVALPVGISNFDWNFLATADAGQHITGVSLTLTFTGTAPGSVYQTVTNASIVSTTTGEEFNVPGSTSSGTPIPSTLTQGVALAGYYSKYHFAFSDSFYIPTGAGLTGVTATVTEAVPEPASFAVLALGGLGLLRRRRKA